MPEFIVLTDNDYEAGIKTIENGIVLVHKELCPHCQNMRKVIDRFSATVSDLQFAEVDSEKAPAARDALGAERAPTIVVIRKGAVVARKAGLMNPHELAAFYSEA